MLTRVLFTDGTAKDYDVTGRYGEPDVPFTFQFDIGQDADRQQVIIPLFVIKTIEFPEIGEWR